MLALITTLLLSNVDRVTVLADRAEVVRTGAARCVGGRAELRFDGIPISVDERTLEPSATAPAKVLGSSSRVVAAGEDARRKELEAALEAARREQRANADRAQGVGEELQQLAAYERFVDPLLREELRGPKPNPEAWRRALDALSARALAADARLVELAPARRKIDREIAKLEQRLAWLSQDPGPDARSVSVAVDCGGQAEVKVALGYVVPGASWRPEYEVRFVPEREGKAGRGRVEILVAAVVAQSSGEDWSDAAISLSTSRPALGAEVPEPAAILVDGHPAGEEKVLVQGTEDRSSLQGSSTAGGAQGPAKVGLEDGGRAFVLQFPGRATIPSDGRGVWLPVDVLSGPAEVRLVAIPKLDARVFQALAFENPGRYPLLAGRARMHRAGTFVGEISLDHLAPGAPAELSLGADGELAVERKDVESLDRAAGFLSSTKKLERHLRIKLTNQASAGQRIELRENIPVPKDEAIEVKLDTKRTTAGYKLDAARGILVWSVELASGKSRELDLAYVVKLPESWRVQ